MQLFLYLQENDMRLIVTLLSLLLSGCYNRASDPELDSAPVTANITIAKLKSICNSEIITFTATAPVVVSGTVISCDKQGYINGAIYIDDGTATAKVLVDIYDSFSFYPEGCKISITMVDLSAQIADSQLTIGQLSKRDNSLIGFKSIVTLDKHITRYSSIDKIEPLNCTISQIDNSLCGKLVSINDLNYVYTCYEEHYKGKYLRFCDSDQNFIYIYIDNYASGFSNLPPIEATDVTGIVTYQNVPFDQNNCFVILPRRSSDIWH